MTNEEILTKAIQKAIDGGWNFEPIMPWRDQYGILKLKTTLRFMEYDVERIIFDHDFAKALWGEAEFEGLDAILAEPDLFTGARGATHYWRYHLMQMAIADDPIKYLGENI